MLWEEAAKDRRRALRVRAPGGVMFREALAGAETSQWAKGYLVDLSEMGARMLCAAPVERGHNLELRLELAENTVLVEGVCVRADEGGMAVSFTFVEDDAYTILREYIAELRARIEDRETRRQPKSTQVIVLDEDVAMEESAD
jgi:hypothetical protein